MLSRIGGVLLVGSMALALGCEPSVPTPQPEGLGGGTRSATREAESGGRSEPPVPTPQPEGLGGGTKSATREAEGRGRSESSTTSEAPPSNPAEPSPPPPIVALPTAPTRSHACLISEAAQTWKGSAKCGQATGQCERSASGELIVQRTGPKSAMISTSGFTDGGASFDPKTCTVSHAHWTPKAPIPISLSYSFVVSPEGHLSGSLNAVVKHSVFGCTGNYSLSGTKE